MMLILRIFIFIIFCWITFSFTTKPVLAAITSWQKAANFYPQSSTDFSSESFRQSLRNFAAVGGNFATLVLPFYQSNIFSSDIQRGWNTPTDDSLVSGINYAHSLGMKVMLKPHIDTFQQDWRANIDPSNRSTWFSNYGNVINQIGNLATQTGVEEISLGAELYKVTSPNINPANPGHWNTLIANLKNNYTGQLTYSAQRDGFYNELSELPFWSQLDHVGISAYYDLNPFTQNPTVANYVDYWSLWYNNQIQPAFQRIQKPIVFSEIGYKSVTGAHIEPWEYTRQGPPNQAEQANLYQALFEFWNNVPFMQGIHIWDWSTNPNAGGPTDIDYTPQNKTAQGVIQQWFSQTATTPTPSSPPSNAAYQISAQATPASPVNSQSTSILVSINPSNSVFDSIVDIEIYNSLNQKSFQQIFEHQNLTSNTVNNFQLIWTPTSIGDYTVKVGLFTNNWLSLLKWEDNASTITVLGSSPSPVPSPTPVPIPIPTPTPVPTPIPSPSVIPSPIPTPLPSPQPTTGNIDIWWPASLATISGIQPFKAVIYELSLSSYQLFWQVDGGQLNLMSDNNVDYPHKESLVDVGGWNWRGSGPYVINFIAKNNSGEIINQKSININVNH